MSTTIASSFGDLPVMSADDIVTMANLNCRAPHERSELRQIIDTLAPNEGIVLTQDLLASMLEPGKSPIVSRLTGLASARQGELKKFGIEAKFTVRSLGDGAFGIARLS